jgi:hypothetical protein
MRLGWLNTRFGIDFVAVGLFAVCIGVTLVLIQDIWFMATGSWPAIWLYHKVLSYLAAAIATVFSVVSFFVFRPGLPKYVAIMLTVSFASYVIQPFLPIHVYHVVAVLCVARTIGFSTLLLLARAYFLDLKAGKVAR